MAYPKIVILLVFCVLFIYTAKSAPTSKQLLITSYVRAMEREIKATTGPTTDIYRRYVSIHW